VTGSAVALTAGCRLAIHTWLCGRLSGGGGQAMTAARNGKAGHSRCRGDGNVRILVAKRGRHPYLDPLVGVFERRAAHARRSKTRPPEVGTSRAASLLGRTASEEPMYLSLSKGRNCAVGIFLIFLAATSQAEVLATASRVT